MHAILSALIFIAALIDYTVYVIIPILFFLSIAIVGIVLIALANWLYYTEFMPFFFTYIFLPFMDFIENSPYLP